MLNIAIVEDDSTQSDHLTSMLKSYSTEYSIPIKITVFSNAIIFITDYKAEYDIIFMDIMMPMMNGMDAAKILREKDNKVILIFITQIQQYAIDGYEVGALDYILKPLQFPEFKLKFTRILDKLSLQKDEKHIIIKSDSGFAKLSIDQILYVEVQQHHCTYHTLQGEFKQYQTLKNAESQLEGMNFIRCNNFLLVNLAHVSKIEGMNAYVNGKSLQISFPKKKNFVEKFVEYLGGAK